MAPPTGSTKRRKGRSVSSAASQSSPNISSLDNLPTAPQASDTMRTIFRYCATTVLLAVLAALAAFAVPAVQSSALWSDALANHSSLTTSKVALLTTQDKARSSNGPMVKVLASYPHDVKAFTQGLLVAQQGTDKFFVESTGLYGQSSLRKVDITTGNVLAKLEFNNTVFAEGVTLGPDGELIMVTWQEKLGHSFKLSPASASGGPQFTLEKTFSYETVTGEGWGIDYDGTHLVVSDGSSKLMFWDPKTKKTVREVTVTFNDEELPKINELEFANGFIYANVWYEDVIVKIDPKDGKVVAFFDCSELFPQSGAAQDDTNAVLNGIAYDGAEDVFYITGKLWGRVFKVRLLE